MSEHEGRSAARNAWIDRQMQRRMRDTILTGICAGLGTTASTLTISVCKWLIVLLIAGLR